MHDIHQAKRFILTGTPGSGKTSVIKELDKLGHAVIHEAATDVIILEQAKGIESPWENPEFIEHIIHVQKKRQVTATAGVQFYDRSPFCTYALGQYLSHTMNMSFTPTKCLMEEMDRCLNNKLYQKGIFFFENLGFIEHTEARKISYEDALIFEQIHLDVYKEFGFDIVMVPKGLTVEERCRFVLEKSK